MDKYYSREEEFVREFYNWAALASEEVNREWRPDMQCNDEKRQSQQYFLASGELNYLAFRSASLSRDGGKSQVCIVLESSKRLVNVVVEGDADFAQARITLDESKE